LLIPDDTSGRKQQHLFLRAGGFRIWCCSSRSQETTEEKEKKRKRRIDNKDSAPLFGFCALWVVMMMLLNHL
jgi:predicted nucleic acid-binding Zn ribbon protein